MWTRLWRVPFGRRRCKDIVSNLSGKRTELTKENLSFVRPFRTCLQSDDDRSFFVIILKYTKRGVCKMLETLNAIDSFIWGPPLLILLIGTGILLTARLRLLQISKLPRALKLIFTAKNQGDGDVDSFKPCARLWQLRSVPVILSALRRQFMPAVPELFSGCGWQLSSAWPRNMLKAV